LSWFEAAVLNNISHFTVFRGGLAQNSRALKSELVIVKQLNILYFWQFQSYPWDFTHEQLAWTTPCISHDKNPGRWRSAGTSHHAKKSDEPPGSGDL
jgi:hypothetical protein